MKTSQKFAAIAMCAFGAMALNTASAQSTSSTITGRAPADATITAHSDKGITRHGTPNSKGRYSLSALLPGTYEVSLEKDGKTLATVKGVPLFASWASEVNFTCENDQCIGAFKH